jgi:ribosome-binding ATPase YchF (GTP1/OBG family)
LAATVRRHRPATASPAPTADRAAQAAQVADKMRSDGTDYVVQDGDVVPFRFNVQ